MATKKKTLEELEAPEPGDETPDETLEYQEKDATGKTHKTVEKHYYHSPEKEDGNGMIILVLAIVGLVIVYFFLKNKTPQEGNNNENVSDNGENCDN